ncbi:MAG: prepilin peptidase [Lachnospiraceae bacterium]|nr:prepilin peptidase [Lachnospiraceae bacterium]
MYAVMISCLLVTAVTADLMTDRIPNALTVTGMAAGFLYAFARAGPPALLPVLGDVFVMFLVTFLLFALRALRGGDGKLLCALSALLGIHDCFRILFYSMLFALLIGGGKCILQIRKEKKITWPPKRLTKIHYSVPILLATAVCFINLEI